MRYVWLLERYGPTAYDNGSRASGGEHGYDSTEFMLRNGHTTAFDLESPHILKVFFEIRNNSDALYSQYHICVNGISNVQ
jgi:hypothetical protein